MTKRTLATLLLSSAIAAAMSGSSTAAHATQMSCGELGAKGLFANTIVQATAAFAADAKTGLPAFCQIEATISPVPGSKIGAVLRLPENWNGKLLGLGGGGWMGNVSMNAFSGVGDALRRGYATAQTDGGHPIDEAFNASWATGADGKTDWVKVEDFSFRAIHETAALGKEIVAKYYGKPQSQAYFQGCSTGGRQGFMEAQRYPADYDGIVAGAPVYTLAVQSSTVIRDMNFDDPARRLTSEQFALVNKAALDKCDAADGSKDGVITDPRKCNFDPGLLACKAGEAANTCLSPPQIDAVRSAYKGVKLPDGRTASYPLARGGEAGWARFIAAGTPLPGNPRPGSTGGGGTATLLVPLFGDAHFEMSKFDVQRDVPKMRDGDFAKDYEAKDPNLSAFVARGGKLIIWQGFNDAGPSAFAAIEYFDAVQKSTKPTREIGDHVRLFVAPGVEHCGGGPGPSQIDTLTALENWVEQSKAPKEIIATKPDKSLAWPLCPYPALPHYKGKGALNDPKNYSCK